MWFVHHHNRLHCAGLCDLFIITTPSFCWFVSFVDYYDLLHWVSLGDFVCHKKKKNQLCSCMWYCPPSKIPSSFLFNPSHCPAGTKKKDKFWIPLSEQAVTLIYRLADQPDSLCGDLIHRMAASLLQETQVATDSQEGGEWAWHTLSFAFRLLPPNSARFVMPLKGHSLSPRSCPSMRSVPSERLGYW